MKVYCITRSKRVVEVKGDLFSLIEEWISNEIKINVLSNPDCKVLNPDPSVKEVISMYFVLSRRGYPMPYKWEDKDENYPNDVMCVTKNKATVMAAMLT